MDDRKYKVEISTVSGIPGMHSVNGVHGYLIEGDCTYLYQCAQSMPNRAKLLEVGSFMGLSASMLALGVIDAGRERCEIFCVDTWKGSPEHQRYEIVAQGLLREAFEANMKRLGIRDVICAINMTSARASDLFENRSLDLVFLDGAHDYDSVMDDIRRWRYKVKRRGKFIGHDYTHDDVRRAVIDSGINVRIIPNTNGMWEMLWP